MSRKFTLAMSSFGPYFFEVAVLLVAVSFWRFAERLLVACDNRVGKMFVEVKKKLFAILNKPATAQVGAISKAQKYSRNNFWKHLGNFFQKKDLVKKSHNAEKPKKRPFRLIKCFYKPKTSSNSGGTLWQNSKNFGKKSHSAEKNLTSTSGSIKKFLV